MRGKVLKLTWKRAGAIVLVGMILITGWDILRIHQYEVSPRKPKSGISSGQDQIYLALEQGQTDIDWSGLQGTLDYINGHYDCSDFRIVNLLRIMYKYQDRIPGEYRQKIKSTLQNFRFWWDCPGTNSMCYWSENHQILFASAEYLTGQYYPDDVFSNSGLRGKQHMERARQRILDWLEMRWKYGFTEFNSEVYYKEDIGAMINLIDLAHDDEIVLKTQIIMDMLMYDVATQNIHGMFVSASGRAYEGNRKGGPGKDLGGLTGYYWGSGSDVHSGMVRGMQYSNKYHLPSVIRAIALDSGNVVIREHSGLDIPQIKTEGYFGDDNRSLMMQLGMESFTNPEVVRNTLSWMRQHRMFGNDFLKDFQILDYSLIKWLHLEPMITRVINPQSNGVVLRGGDVYTYKTNDYSLYSVQNYFPGDFGDQHHVAGMNIRNYFSIFHNHPALEAQVKNQSPNYWVGYGHLPHVAQDSSVSMAIYNIPAEKGLMEMDLLDYTHAYFPAEKFDSVILKNNYAFGKKGNTYCALIGSQKLQYKNDDRTDLIQKGKKSCWIIEAGNASADGNFNLFVGRILNNHFDFDESTLQLEYHSKHRKYTLAYQADFTIDGKAVNFHYPRYDSPYSRAKFKPAEITYRYDNKSLYLNFDKLIREEKAE